MFVQLYILIELSIIVEMRPNICIDDYYYDLPEDRIAKYPLEHRNDSKLLINQDNNYISDSFKNIASYLPSNSFMVFNNTKVVPARLFFKRDTGAIIEIFCLEPSFPADYNLNFAQTSSCRWKALIGNVKRFKSQVKLLVDSEISNEIKSLNLCADLISREDNTATVEFSWQTGISFSQVLAMVGKLPIPPYLNRETQEIDYERYQTMYARQNGSVAAPTAGLHFTESELKDIVNKGIKIDYLCLHVGAGTFLPVKSEHIVDHVMHSEPFTVTKQFLLDLNNAISSSSVISVGTTSTRCLESLYYIGIHCIVYGEPGVVQQWEPYDNNYVNYSPLQAISAIIKYLDDNGLQDITSRTSLIIVPGYKFHFIDYLVTNFHQPKSTLLLLISAAIGEDWRKMYSFALDNGFRFLSYGDSSLLKVIK